MAKINGKCPFCEKEVTLESSTQVTICPHCSSPFATQTAVEKACETDMNALINKQYAWEDIKKEISTYKMLMSIEDYESAYSSMSHLSSKHPTNGLSYLIKAHFYISTTHSIKTRLFIRTNYPSLATCSELDEIERKLALKQDGVRVPGTSAKKEYF